MGSIQRETPRRARGTLRNVLPLHLFSHSSLNLAQDFPSHCEWTLDRHQGPTQPYSFFLWSQFF